MIEEHIGYGHLRQDTYELIKDPIARRDLRLFISGLLSSSEVR